MLSNSFQRKLQFIFFLFVLLFTLLFLRLVDVQIFQGSEYFELSEHNRYFDKKEKTERAVFLDRYGQAVTENQTEYWYLRSADQIYSEKTLLNYDQALPILATQSAQIAKEYSRRYPYKEALAHVLGYLTPVTAEDLEKNSDTPWDDFLGRMGLEKTFDQSLRSIASSKKYEVNALGQKQKLVSFQAAEYGSNIQTTLDPYLSLVAYRAMNGQKGAVLILDAETGAVLVLLSSPSFDPNMFEENYLSKLGKLQPEQAEEASSAATVLQDYFSNPNQVFYNRAVSGSYPPGSIFKLVTALGALQDGAIDANSQVQDEGVLKVGDYEYNNWYYTQYGRVEGTVDVRRAIARSNDIFFYKTAEWLGPDRLANYARLFSFGKSLPVQLDSVATGLVPDPTWKESTRGEDWYLGNTYHFGIGQGDLLVTPLQVAVMTQTIANHGNLCSPTLLVHSPINCQSLSLKEEYLELVLAGMIDACSTGGTAYPLYPYNQRQDAELSEEKDTLSAYQQVEAGKIACKTGTAEFGETDSRGYKKTHAWTTGIVGVPTSLFQNAQQGEEATASAALAFNVDNNYQLSAQELRQVWLKENTASHNFPKKLAITVLVESDEQDLYKEGSDDAALVIAKILNWMEGYKLD